MSNEGVIDYKGREYALYPRLLAEAHKQGLHSIHSQLLQAPCAQNGHLAIVWAEVKTEKGAFSGIGDASPENVGRMVAGHIVRMAETRAKARALRDALNIMVLLEGEDDVAGQDEGVQAAPIAQAPTQPAEPTSYQTLIDCASWIYDHTGGIVMALPEEDSPQSNAAYLAHLKAEYAKMTSKQSPMGRQQYDAIRALLAQLGRSDAKGVPLSAYGAQIFIRQLLAEQEQKEKEAMGI